MTDDPYMDVQIYDDGQPEREPLYPSMLSREEEIRLGLEPSRYPFRYFRIPIVDRDPGDEHQP